MKILKKLKNVIIVYLIIITIIFSLVPPNSVEAKTLEDVGSAIAATAIDFCNRYASESIYDWGISGGYYNETIDSVVPEFWGREQAYQNKKTSGLANSSHYTNVPYTNKYAMDCVGFVSMIMHCATGLGSSSFTYFAQPTQYGSGNGLVWATIDYMENASGTPKVGDIICWNGHVAIAVSSTEVVDCIPAGVARRSISNYNYMGSYRIVRVKESAVNSTNLRYSWYDGSSQATGSNSGSSNPGSNVSDNSIEYVVNKHSYGDAEKFYYNGMPKSGNYLGRDNSNWLIDFLADVADWLVGIITLGYKIQLVGWSSIFQNLATGLVGAIVNQDANKTITVETILFNQVQILDVNFFNFDNAGGDKIESNDITYMLRQNVAGLYFSIRNIAIIVMLVILIYVGIRMALSTISGDKAKYKKMFISWIVGFIIIMFIHYFMVFIINSNEQVIGFMKPADNATVIYDEVRSYAYEIPASKGWTGAIMYVFLVYYMIKLLLFYFKRLLVVYVLAIMAPILGITYAIEKIKGKSKSLTTWMKEFSFNILIQSIHVIIYSLFMSIIYSFMKTTSIGRLIPYAIIMVLILNLMLKSEKIIKKIFGLKSNTMKDIADTVFQTSSTLMTAFAIARPVYNLGKKKVSNVYNKRIENGVNNRYKNLENSLEEVNNSKLATDIQREIDRLKQKEIDDRKAFNKNAMDLSKGIFGGMKGMVTAAPMMFEGGPVQGTLSIINAGSNLNSRMRKIGEEDIDEDKIDKLLKKYNMNPVNPVNPANPASPSANSSSTKPIRTFNTSKNKRYSIIKGIGGFTLASATARTSTRVKNTWEDFKEENEKIKNPYQSKRIELLYKLQAKVLEEERKMNSSIDNLRNNGFPPVYYTPGENESEQTVSMNLKLQEQYSKELEINLRQAMAGDPKVTKDMVALKLAEQMSNTGKLSLTDLQKTLDEIAKENDYEVGTEFEKNVKDEVKRNIMDAAEGKETRINKDAIKSDILQKVERALSSNNWDENTSQNEIEMVVTKDVAEEIINQLSASELTSIITSAVNRKGSLKNKKVDTEFEPIVNSAAKIADINKDIAELENNKYNTEELIENILNKKVQKQDNF